MASYLDETGLGTLISLIKQWTLDEITASSGGSRSIIEKDIRRHIYG